MDDYQCVILKQINIYICILHNLFDWRQPHHQPKRKEISSWYKKFKIFFSEKKNFAYWKFKDTISKSFKATRQHNSCDFVLWKFLALVISVMSEWSIENTAAFPCKISSFSKKYILNKILVMRLVVLYKYMNCTVDKTTYIY